MKRFCISLAPLLLIACGGGRPTTLTFKAKVGAQDFDCAAQYADIGTTLSTLQPLDFRLFLSGLQLVRANGEKVPLELDQEGEWQLDDIALLDFQSGDGLCEAGSPQTRTVITGKAPAHEDYEGLEFTLGIPEERNHLDAAAAQPPLNNQGLWWSWKGGYKFLKLDIRSRGNSAYYVHLGADGCTGTNEGGWTCQKTNQTPVRLTGFHPDNNAVVFDVGALLAQSDLDAAVDGQTDFVHGCMSSVNDPECAPIFQSLGLPLGSGPVPLTQTFVTVE